MKKYKPNSDLKMIAAEISRQAAAGSYRQYTDPRTITSTGTRANGSAYSESWEEEIPRAEFAVGTTRLRCDDTPECIAKLIARYAKGNPANLRHGKPDRWFPMPPGKDYGAEAIVEHETLATSEAV